MSVMTTRSPTCRRACWHLFLLGAGVLLSGCGQDTPQMDEHELIEQYNVQGRRHDPVKYVEIDLGEYFVPRDIENSADVLFVKCHLYAVTDKKDRGELDSALYGRRTRMRDVVMSALRQTELEALSEPNMKWLKSELVPSINKILKTSAVRDVVLADFSLERG